MSGNIIISKKQTTVMLDTMNEKDENTPFLSEIPERNIDKMEEVSIEELSSSSQKNETNAGESKKVSIFPPIDKSVNDYGQGNIFSHLIVNNLEEGKYDEVARIFNGKMGVRLSIKSRFKFYGAKEYAGCAIPIGPTIKFTINNILEYAIYFGKDTEQKTDFISWLIKEGCTVSADCLSVMPARGFSISFYKQLIKPRSNEDLYVQSTGKFISTCFSALRLFVAELLFAGKNNVFRWFSKRVKSDKRFINELLVVTAYYGSYKQLSWLVKDLQYYITKIPKQAAGDTSSDKTTAIKHAHETNIHRLLTAVLTSQREPFKKTDLLTKKKIPIGPVEPSKKGKVKKSKSKIIKGKYPLNCRRYSSCDNTRNNLSLSWLIYGERIYQEIIRNVDSKKTKIETIECELKELCKTVDPSITETFLKDKNDLELCSGTPEGDPCCYSNIHISREYKFKVSQDLEGMEKMYKNLNVEKEERVKLKKKAEAYNLERGKHQLDIIKYLLDNKINMVRINTKPDKDSIGDISIIDTCYVPRTSTLHIALRNKNKAMFDLVFNEVYNRYKLGSAADSSKLTIYHLAMRNKDPYYIDLLMSKAKPNYNIENERLHVPQMLKTALKHNNMKRLDYAAETTHYTVSNGSPQLYIPIYVIQKASPEFQLKALKRLRDKHNLLFIGENETNTIPATCHNTSNSPVEVFNYCMLHLNNYTGYDHSAFKYHAKTPLKWVCQSFTSAFNIMISKSHMRAQQTIYKTRYMIWYYIAQTTIVEHALENLIISKKDIHKKIQFFAKNIIRSFIDSPKGETYGINRSLADVNTRTTSYVVDIRSYDLNEVRDAETAVINSLNDIKEIVEIKDTGKLNNFIITLLEEFGNDFNILKKHIRYIPRLYVLALQSFNLRVSKPYMNLGEFVSLPSDIRVDVKRYGVPIVYSNAEDYKVYKELKSQKESMERMERMERMKRKRKRSDAQGDDTTRPKKKRKKKRKKKKRKRIIKYNKKYNKN